MDACRVSFCMLPLCVWNNSVLADNSSLDMYKPNAFAAEGTDESRNQGGTGAQRVTHVRRRAVPLSIPLSTILLYSPSLAYIYAVSDPYMRHL